MDINAGRRGRPGAKLCPVRGDQSQVNDVDLLPRDEPIPPRRAFVVAVVAIGEGERFGAGGHGERG